MEGSSTWTPGTGWIAVALALISLAGVIYTARQGKRSADKSNAIEANRADAESYETARENWRAILEDLRGQITGLRARVEELESRDGWHSRRFALAVQYIRQLTAEMRRHNLPVPQAPDDINVE